MLRLASKPAIHEDPRPMRPNRPPAISSRVRRGEVRDRIEAMLLGGAIGDALGAGLEFLGAHEVQRLVGPAGPTTFLPAYGRSGAITDDTQMTLFTAEGLIRARVRAELKGICNLPSVVRYAYVRLLSTQGIEPHPSDQGCGSAWRNGWLLAQPELHARRAPGRTCIAGLLDGRIGTLAEPLNTSKGCGTVMRVAPVAVLHLAGVDAFAVGCETAALTHGHATAILAAGALALTLGYVLEGASLHTALDLSRARLRGERGHEETERALAAAVALAASPTPPSMHAVASLGPGWVAEEALSVAVYCALVAPDPLAGLRLAVTHGGDSDSTGAIAGHLLGALHGSARLPADLVRDVEARDVIRQVAHDLCAHLLERPSGLAERDWERYPGT
jgi:ADP-ribosylglycohydrolase